VNFHTCCADIIPSENKAWCKNFNLDSRKKRWIIILEVIKKNYAY